MKDYTLENPRLISNFDMKSEKLEAVMFMDNNPTIAAMCFQIVSKFSLLDYHFLAILVEVCGLEPEVAKQKIGNNWPLSQRITLLKKHLDQVDLTNTQSAFFEEFFEEVDSLKDIRHLLCHAAPEQTGNANEFRLRDRFFSKNPGEPKIFNRDVLAIELEKLERLIYATFKMLAPALQKAGGTKHY